MRQFPLFAVASKIWIPLVIVAVLVVGGYAVAKVRGVFGSHVPETYAGSMTDDSNNSNPKRVTYEIFGPPGAVADINYFDDEGQTNQVNGATLPWSVTLVTNAPAMMGNVVAQGTSDFIGCRITANGEVKDERTAHQVSAYIYCFSKSA
ncbi:MmpS family transport accessory protein [Mycolicibacillus trivialis]